MHDEDLSEAKYYLLIKKRESTGLKYLIDLKTFIKYSNDMGDIYKNIEEYNSIKNTKYINRISWYDCCYS